MSKIKVCDAIMGSGKTTAAICHMNMNRNRKFIYVTPYLNECERIMKSCPALNFVMPKASDTAPTKLEHTYQLIQKKRNISTTHQSFRMYGQKYIDAIKEAGYTLIIDESVDCFNRRKGVTTEDVDLLVSGGYLRIDDRGFVERTGKKYHGTLLKPLLNELDGTRNITLGDESKGNNTIYMWAFPNDVLVAFDEVFILTYLFEASNMYAMFKINNVEYDKIGVKRSGNIYEFTSNVDEYYRSDAAITLRDKIKIYKRKNRPYVGEGYYDLSGNWFSKMYANGGEENPSIKNLKGSIRTFFRNYSNCSSKEFLWTTFKGGYGEFNAKDLLNDSTYKCHFCELNLRATNKFSDRKALAFCANLFPDVAVDIYMKKYNASVDPRLFALSTLVQWVWRSAIRNGNNIILYIPSKRMRNLFEVWLDFVAEGGAYGEDTEELLRRLPDGKEEKRKRDEAIKRVRGMLRGN